MLSGHLTDSWPVVIWWDDRSCLSLDWLDDDTCDSDTEFPTGLELSLHSISISELDEVNWSAIHLSYWITIESLPHH